MLHRRNSLRLKFFNYSAPSVYFVTLCVNQHLCLFGQVTDKMLKLNAAGKMVAKVFTNLSQYYTGILIDTYIVMPDHFHGIITIDHPVGAGLCARPKIENGIQTSNDQTLFFDHPRVTNKCNDTHSDWYKWRQACSTKNGRASVNYWNSLNGRARRPAPTDDQIALGEIIGRFKSYTTTQYISGVKNNQWKAFYEKLWQRGYYDHIVKDKKELFAIRNYITNNPLHWNK